MLIGSWPWGGFLGFSEVMTFWLAIAGMLAGGIAVGMEIERQWLGPRARRLGADPHAEWKWNGESTVTSRTPAAESHYWADPKEVPAREFGTPPYHGEED